MSKSKRVDTKRNMALGGMFVFFTLLFNAPFITIPRGYIGKIPLLILYIVTVWILLTALMVVLSYKPNSKQKK